MSECSIKSKRVQLTLVEMDDAPFILRLRTDSKLNRHISPVENSLEKQRQWIKDYKTREANQTEFYWIIGDMKGNAFGVCRLYGRSFDGKSIEGGSLIVLPNSPHYMAFEAPLLGFMFAFSLGIEKILLNVRKQNKTSLHKFELLIGSKAYDEDELNVYYELTKQAFETVKESKLKKYLARYF